jgi:hypothetical protein
MFRGLALAVVLAANTASLHGVSRNGGANTAAAQNHTQPKAGLQPSDSVAIQNAIKGITAALVAANNKQPSKEEKEEARRNLKAQENLANWAPWMFDLGFAEIVVTGGGILVLLLTLSETRRIGQAQVRSYLSSEESKYVIEGGSVWCWPMFKNNGQSPASSVSAIARLTVIGEGYVHRTGYEATTITTIPSGHAGNGMFAFAAIPAKDLERLMEGQSFSVEGHFKWHDVFGKAETCPFTLMRIGEGKIISVADGVRRCEGTLHADNRDIIQETRLWMENAER